MTQQQLAPVLYIPGDVRSCAAVDGRNGPQWLIEVAVDFSQYPLKIYLEQSDYPDPIQPGLYPRCVFERLRLISPDRDASVDYNWRWRVASFDAAPPEDAWVGDPSTIDGSAEPHPGPRPDPAPAPVPQPSPAPAGEITQRDDHPDKRASIEGQSADKIRADVLGIAGRLVAAEMSYTSDVDSQDWQLVAEGWYRSLMSIPSWGDDLHGEGDGE
jgi:hypothetical protein